MLLTLKEGELAVRLAREAVEQYVRERKVLKKELEGKFAEKRGVFTTLNKHGMLRGCIGFPYPVKRLDEAIIDSAISAAVKDPRFPPVGDDELQDIVVEVTVLTPPQRLEAKPLERSKYVKVGKDGLMVKKGMFSGLLLPQVAVEHNFDEEEFLTQTCLKAGLPPDCWLEEDTEVYVFQGQIFEETEPYGRVVERDLMSCER